MLLSQHRDAEWLSRAAGHMGFETIRGSTYRGAGTALRKLMGKGKFSNLAITPDGPRGPRRKMAQGPIFLSSRLQIPLIPIGLGYDRPWRLRTWDQFAVPRPFSRGRIVLGPRIQIPRDLDRSGMERYRQQTEQLLERLTFEAESWAAAGSRKTGQFPFNRTPKPWWSRRREPVSAGEACVGRAEAGPPEPDVTCPAPLHARRRANASNSLAAVALDGPGTTAVNAFPVFSNCPRTRCPRARCPRPPGPQLRRDAARSRIDAEFQQTGGWP